MTARMTNIVLGTIAIVFGGYIYVTSTAFKNQAAAQMPYVVAVTMIVLGLFLVAANARSGADQSVPRPFEGVPWPMWFLSVGMAIGLAVAMVHIGFYEAAFIFLTVMTSVLFATTQGWHAGIRKGAVFGVVYTLVLWVLMDLILNLRTPRGLLFG